MDASFTGQYACYVLIHGERQVLEEVAASFDPCVLRPLGEVEVLDGGESLTYAYTGDAPVDLSAWGRWQAVAAEAVWIKEGGHAGTATRWGSAVRSFTPTAPWALFGLLRWRLIAADTRR